MTLDADCREDAVEDAVFRWVEHELPEQRHDERARQMRKEIQKPEPDTHR